MASVFYYFAYSTAKKERMSFFQEKSINQVSKFVNISDYYQTIVKKYAPSKEFVFLLNENFFVKNLSVKSSKDLIAQIKKSEKNIKNIYIFDSNYKEVFSQKMSVDIKKLLKQTMLITENSLFVYSYIDNKKGILVFEVELTKLQENLKSDLFVYYLVDKNGNIVLSSNDFKKDLYTKFHEESKLIEKDDLIYYFIPMGEYMMGTVVKKGILLKRINNVFLSVMLFIVLISILSMFQSVRASYMITSPIYKLTKVLGENRDGEYKKIDLKGDEEIEYFVSQYNDMIERIAEFTHGLEEKVQDRTQKIEKQKEELKKLSQTDALTGIYNRNKLNDIVIQRQKYDVMYSVIILDIDNFKFINDKYGHDVGDEILKEFANILQDNTRASDFLGRWGGEEFIIICSNITKDKAYNIAEKVREIIENFNFYKGLRVTASFGVAQYAKGTSYEELFKLADDALYKAKNSGKNRVIIA